MNSIYKLLGLAAAFICSSSGFAQTSGPLGLAQNNCPPKKDNCTTVVPCTKKMAVEPFEQGMELPSGKYA